MEEISGEKISVVIQGPIYDDMTKKSCQSIRENLPGAEIVLSTWKGSQVQDLDYDILVENEDPGNFTFVLPKVMDNGTDLYPMNINRQIVSTKNGIENATRQFVCKMRSDSILTGAGFLDAYIKYNNPISQPYNKLLTHRVITLTSVNPKRYFPFCFYLCDWFFFGLKDDVFNMWNIPLVKEEDLKLSKLDGRYYMVDNFGNEQYMWLGFLKKFMDISIRNGYDLNRELLRQSEESYGNCCIFLTAKKAGVYSQKVKNTGYGDATWKSNAGLYTINDWKRMYNEHCGGDLIAVHNPIEEIAYRIARLLRRIKRIK